MKCRVHYVSPKGSAEMIAEAISRETKCVKEPLLPAYMPEGITLMFLGCEGGKADKVTMEFISSMSKDRVANAALFCCSKNSEPALSQMKKALMDRGVNVLDQTLTAPVKGLFGGGPTQKDMDAAKDFAHECMKVLTHEN